MTHRLHLSIDHDGLPKKLRTPGPLCQACEAWRQPELDLGGDS